MEKKQIQSDEIQLLTGLIGIQGVVLVRPELSTVFIDLVFPDNSIFYRVCEFGMEEEMNFKSVSSAVTVLMDEGFPEISIKFDRPLVCAESIYTSH